MHKLGCVPGGWGAYGRTFWGSFAAFRLRRQMLRVVFAILSGAVAARAGEQKSPAPPVFEKDIRPILRAHCLDCHGSQNVRKGGLDLRLRRLMVQGGRVGQRHRSRPSRRRVTCSTGSKSGEMPPGEQKFPPPRSPSSRRGSPPVLPPPTASRPTSGPAASITDEDRDYLGLPPHSPAESARSRPERSQSARRSTPFCSMPCGSKGLVFLARRGQADADPPPVRSIWSGFPPRRATSPPSWPTPLPTRTSGWSIGCWPRRITASAGAAIGSTWPAMPIPKDMTSRTVARPEAFRFRDYVIRAFNADKPFDQFVIEQLAGDELVAASLQEPICRRRSKS